MIDLLDLIRKLISYPSVTPNDCGAIEYIAELLKKSGFEIYIKEFGPTHNHSHTKNLYAIYKNLEECQTVCFAGHIDVVSASGDWTYDPFSATEKEGIIYGRGAVDMKGALGCMIAAAINFIETNTNTLNIAFLITSDEEGDALYGTNAMLEWLNDNDHKIDFAIVGEPTCEKALGDVIKIGRRGSINFTLEVEGKEGHVAYPHLSNNPNKTMVQILNELISLELDDGDEFFARSNLEITSIDGFNNITNIIPSKISAKFNVRFNTIHNESSLVSMISNIIAKHTNDYMLEHKCNAHPFLSKKHKFTDILKDAIIEETSISPVEQTNGGTSDARFIQKYCAVVEFGLLSEQAHKIDEHVKILDLQRLYNVYYSALSKMLDLN